MLDTQWHIDVQEAEYTRLLGYPHGHEITGRAKELADWARTWYAEHGRPWTFDVQSESVGMEDDGVSIDGVSFRSKHLLKHFREARATSAMLVAVSAGPECETFARQLWQAGKPDEYFFLEVYGSAVVEYLIAAVGAQFCARADEGGFAVLPHHSPGYSAWDISEQGKLWSLIRSRTDEQTFLGLEVLDSGMLNPKKSLLAVFGITPEPDRVRRLTDLIPCSRCAMKSCQYRRTGYKYAPRQIEDVSRLQETIGPNQQNGVSLNPNAGYSISPKVLRKWTRDRLTLISLDDGGIEAVFRYDGTTCSNMGHPLAFDYRVVLDSRERGYRLLRSFCSPAPGNDGYMLMCNYIKNGDALLDSIDSEGPPLGRTLDEIVSWTRPFSPAGCYCTAASRNHKWGLALDVIHYALVQLETRQVSPVQTTNS